MGVRIRHKGSFENLEKFLKNYDRKKMIYILNKLGEEGVTSLSNSTPKDTGETAKSWRYKIKQTQKSIGIEWYNDIIVDGTPLVILLQYGHGTGTGGYVHGQDFINPAIQPIFDKISQALWEEVTSL